MWFLITPPTNDLASASKASMLAWENKQNMSTTLYSGQTNPTRGIEDYEMRIGSLMNKNNPVQPSKGPNQNTRMEKFLQY